MSASFCASCKVEFFEPYLYFDDTHAKAFSQDGKQALIWCKRCNSISSYERKRKPPIIGKKQFTYIWSASFASLVRERVPRTPSLQPVYGELLRLIFHVLWRKHEEEEEEEERNAKGARAISEAFDFLPPSEVGWMLAIVCHTKKFIPLEQQLETATYMSEGVFGFDVERWLNTYDDRIKANEAMQTFMAYDKEYRS